MAQTHLIARSTLRARIARNILNSLRISKATSCPAATLFIISGSRKSRMLINTITKSAIDYFVCHREEEEETA